MRKLTYFALTSILTVSFFTLNSIADPGDLFVQVDLDIDNGNGTPPKCSILRVEPDGSLFEFVSFEEIIAVTGETGADCDDTGMVCANNGDIYFSEDFGGDGSASKILKATPGGELSLFVSASEIAAVTGSSPDLDNGMAFGPDGNIYTCEERTDSIIKVTVPGGNVSIEITEAQIGAATGLNRAQLEGGIAIDRDFNFYIAEADSDSVVTCGPGGVDCRVLTTEDQIKDATNSTNISLDEAVVLGGLLYVVVDNCNCIIRIDPRDGIPELFITAQQIMDTTGNDPANPDGGIALKQNLELYIGDDGDGNESNILLSNRNGSSLEIFVSESELENFYSSRAPDSDVDLSASMCVEGVNFNREVVPTLSEWGMLAMAGVLGLVGLLFAMRRRAVSA